MNSAASRRSSPVMQVMRKIPRGKRHVSIATSRVSPWRKTLYRCVALNTAEGSHATERSANLSARRNTATVEASERVGESEGRRPEQREGAQRPSHRHGARRHKRRASDCVRGFAFAEGYGG